MDADKYERKREREARDGETLAADLCRGKESEFLRRFVEVLSVGTPVFTRVGREWVSRDRIGMRESD